MMDSNKFLRRGVLVLVMAGLSLQLGACATRKYVTGQVESMHSTTAERIDGVENQVEQVQTQLAEQEERIEEVSVTAQEALDRAVAAGVLAEGKLLYETVLNSEDLGFEFDSSELAASAQVALDVFAQELKEHNENIFIEVQGHTCSVGEEAYNLRLGERRAASVRSYLSRQHGLPLHRMSVISYGESAPIESNQTQEERARNRRVALVVLR